MLLERRARREARRLHRVDEGIKYVAPFGLLEPKPEPLDVDEASGPSSYMF